MKTRPAACPPAQAATQARRAAFDELHREHARGIYNLALRLLRQPQDAEDTTQEVLLKLFCQLDHGEIANPRAWLYRVTFNHCHDQLSRSARRRSLVGDSDPEAATAPGDPYEQAELARLVEATLDRLPLIQRTALLLRELHGLHTDEVATVLGSAPASAEVTLTRARRTFRARYCELAGEAPAAVGAGALSLVALPASLHLSALQSGLAAALAGCAAGAGSGVGAGAGLGASPCAAAASSGAATLGSAGSGIASQAGVGVLAKIGGALSTKVAVALLSATLVAGGASQVLRHHEREVPQQSAAQAVSGRGQRPTKPLAAMTRRSAPAGLAAASQRKPQVHISALPTLGSAALATASSTPTPSATQSPFATTGAGSPSPTAAPSPSPTTTSSPTISPSPSLTTSPSPSLMPSPSPTPSLTASPSPSVTPSSSPTTGTVLRLAPLPAALRARLGASDRVSQSTSLESLPVRFSYAAAERLGAATTYPQQYDLRSLGRLPAIDDVGTHDACWAFAALDSLESCLLPGDAASFSPDNLLLASGFADTNYDSGGNALQATAYLARWSGPVSGTAEPYGAGLVAGLKPLKHVQEVLFLPPRKGPLANSAIKWAITTHGALEAAMFLDPSIISTASTLYDTRTAAYYCATAHAANHAVDIVGWDNAYPARDFATRPPGNGAFLVRNNWGASWGQGGYFWVSYYDAGIGMSENALFCDAEPTTNYATVYQYDPLGWTEQAAIGYSTDAAWFANRFRARTTQHLTAVSFYTSAANARYRIYASLGSPSDGRLVASGILAWPGYHTVPLASQTRLVAGRFFSVAVRLTTPGSRYPIPLEEHIKGYSDASSSAPGQSYVSANGITWTDITTISGQRETSVCLKAFAR